MQVVGPKRINPDAAESAYKLCWKRSNDGVFSDKSSFESLEGGNQKTVPMTMLWNPILPTKISSFCLRGVVGKDPRLSPTQEEGIYSVQDVPFV